MDVGVVEEPYEINKDLIALQRLIAPEIGELLEMRYKILATIVNEAPIGRRNLAQALDMSERQIRNEIEFLQNQKLLGVERQGVIVSELGKRTIDDLQKILYDYNEIEELEKTLQKALKLKKVFVCPGDVKQDARVMQYMGSAGARYLLSVLQDGDTVALTGGASTGSLVDQMKEATYPNVTVIPARGGIGKTHFVQANNLVAKMGLKLKSNYELLHLPDNLDNRLLEELKDYPEIKHVFDQMKVIDFFIFGIGRAEVLAKRRNLKIEEQETITNQGAVAEAFGHYFNLQGKLVSKPNSISIGLEDYYNIPTNIAIAGGAHKADAIISVSRIKENLVLITDESAANAIIRQL